MKTRIILLVVTLASMLTVACSNTNNPNPNPDGGMDAGQKQCVTDGSDPKNECTDNKCYPFPITQARLPLLNANGTVPPLN